MYKYRPRLRNDLHYSYHRKMSKQYLPPHHCAEMIEVAEDDGRFSVSGCPSVNVGPEAITTMSIKQSLR